MKASHPRQLASVIAANRKWIGDMADEAMGRRTVDAAVIPTREELINMRLERQRIGYPYAKTAAHRLVHQIITEAFALAREPRSAPYLAGVECALMRHADGLAVSCPWRAGTCERDAFFAGVDEGNALWRSHADAATAGGA